MTPRLIDTLDAQTARTLRLLIATRLDAIDALYPVVGSPERWNALNEVFNLIHEFGMETDDLRPQEAR
jgi:hypothetical protein